MSPGDTWATGFAPANETESNLLAAAEENNTDAFLSTLLLARVIVPVPTWHARRRAAARPELPVADRRRATGSASSPCSPRRSGWPSTATRGSGRTSASVSMRFVQLIGAWPSEEISFAINPGSPVGATLPGSQIVALAAWATEVGLRDEPAAEVVVAAKKNESMPVDRGRRGTDRRRRQGHRHAAHGARRHSCRSISSAATTGCPASSTGPARSPTSRRRRRSTGRWAWSTRARPSREDDAEVHVLRWVAHRSDLYRLPYGGQHEAAMRAMQGWVIERPPFRGNGFAPGDTDVVAEFKVDSVRLPHGAQMWRLARDGTETLRGELRRRRRPMDADAVGTGGTRVCVTATTPAGAAASTRSARTATTCASTPPSRRTASIRSGRAGTCGSCRPTRVEDFGYVRTTCMWQGEPFIVLGEADGWLRVEYTGGKAPVARTLGLEEFDYGVYQGWAPSAEVTNLNEYRA